ncbi:MAG: pilus assembly PilX N-terminal domain-containing protein [Candidatus Saccharimonadales bacterium]
MSNKIDNRQAGMVSIMVTMIMMIVITLIVLGFAQVTRRNQREALDRQLSAQAFYAAESGINDAVKYFQANPSASVKTSDCSGFISIMGGVPGTSNILNASNNVAYTCLMANSIPASLQVAPLSTNSNTVWHIKNKDGLAFSSMTFNWSNNHSSPFTGAANQCLGGSSLPVYSAWNCSYGILRVDLVAASSLVGGALEANTNVNSIFMIPNFSGSGSASLSANKALVAQAACNAIQCSLKLTGPGAGALGSSEYYARLTMIYQGSDSATVTAADPAGGVQFEEGQAIIDSTGKAQDELRRIQVRIPLIEGISDLPNFGVQSTDSICKQLSVAPGIYQDKSLTDANCN